MDELALAATQLPACQLYWDEAGAVRGGENALPVLGCEARLGLDDGDVQHG